MLIFGIADHSHNLLDALHKEVSIIYWTSEAFSIFALVKLIQNIKSKCSYSSCLLFPPWDFAKVFEDIVNKMPNIEAVHLIKIYTKGIYTEEQVSDKQWSAWRGNDVVTGQNIEPWSILYELPNFGIQFIYLNISSCQLSE